MLTNPRIPYTEFVTLVSIRVLVLPIVFGTDIFLKVLARSMLVSGERFAFSTSFGLIGFVPSHNDVLAFSLPIPNGWIWPIGWVIVLALLIALVRISDFSSKGGSASGGKFQISNFQTARFAIVFGAISNLLDRTLRGGVTDYLSLTALFPAFNIADLMILGGVVGWWTYERRRRR